MQFSGAVVRGRPGQPAHRREAWLILCPRRRLIAKQNAARASAQLVGPILFWYSYLR
jgi:hypothetical protein